MKITEKNEIIIHQCLYGYDDGHRLLSSSLILDYKTQLELLKKSDIAPNISEMPKGGYYSGFPIVSEKKYVLMKTWEASEMSRPGCVWSHILLISFSDLEFIRSLESLDSFLRRPEEARLVPSFYSKAIHMENNKHYNPNVIMDEMKFLEIVNLVYGSTPRQPYIYSQNPIDYMRDVYLAWSQQWPKLRRSFTFSTTGILNSSSIESYKKNDLIFIIDKNKKIDSKKDNNWSKDLVKWMKTENIDLQKFLWLFGGFFREGRLKFTVILELYSFSRKKRESEITNYDDLFSILRNRNLESAEVLFSLEYFLPKNNNNKNKDIVFFTYNLIKFFPDYYKYFNDELLLQFRLYNITSSLRKDEINLLVNFDLLESGFPVSNFIIENSDIETILEIAIKDPRLVEYIVDRRRNVIAMDVFYSLPESQINKTINKHWNCLDNELQFKIAEKACNNGLLSTLSILIENNYVRLIELLVSQRYLIKDLYHSKFRTEFIRFTLSNLDFAISLDSDNENFLCEILELTGYDKNIIDSISIHSTINSINSSLNRFNEIRRFNYFSFIYYRLYSTDEDYALPAMVFSFLELHYFIARNVADQSGWKLLIEVIPAPIKNKEWDDCMRLRLSLIKYCQIRPNSAKNILGLIKGDRKTFKKIINDLMDYIKIDSDFFFPKL